MTASPMLATQRYQQTCHPHIGATFAKAQLVVQVVQKQGQDVQAGIAESVPVDRATFK